MFLFPRDYAILTQSFALSIYSEFKKISCNYRIVRAFSVFYRIVLALSAYSKFTKISCDYRIVRAFSVFLCRASGRELFLLSGLHGDSRRIEKSFSIGMQEAASSAVSSY